MTIAQSSFQNYLDHSRVKPFIYGKRTIYFVLQHKDKWASFQNSFQNTGKLNSKLSLPVKKSCHQEFLVNAVATFEPKNSVQSGDEEKEINVLSSTDETRSSDSTLSVDPEEIDEKEKLRRMRISKANKGKVPWNKGRKHSPETIKRIQERTRLAMQNPKVKMKLANYGYAQSQVTRERIAVGVRLSWKKRRAKLLLQENCLFDWQNLIADAARKGFQDEDELLWDSYTILNEQLQQEWLASIEDRKVTPRPKVSRRAPKSLEQRRKIAEAIAAKWADPDYRSRVCSGMAKFHGTVEGDEGQVTRNSSVRPKSTRTSKKKVSNADLSTEAKVKTQQPELKKRAAPRYKDPSANSKFEMLKNIREKRVASEAKKDETLRRAKLLIAEAEIAANALEIAALHSPVARASLVEARQLIAEATRSIRSIKNKELTFQDDPTSGYHVQVEKDEISLLKNDTDQGLHKLNGTSTGIAQKNDSRNHVRKYVSTLIDDANQEHGEESGSGFVHITDEQNLNTGVYKMPTMEQMVVNDELPRRPNDEFRKINLGNSIGQWKSRELLHQQHSQVPNGRSPYKHDRITKFRIHGEQVHPTPVKIVTKKWVRGRLVEIRECE